MLNRSASLAMSTSVLEAMPGKLDIKRHSPSIFYIYKVPVLAEQSICVNSIKIYSEDLARRYYFGLIVRDSWP